MRAVGPYTLAMYDALDEVIETFQWGKGDTVLGDVAVDRDTSTLVLKVFALDTDDPDPQEMGYFEARVPVDALRDPHEQIRDLIHWYLCHEADEQMLFDGVMAFDPHERNTA